MTQSMRPLLFLFLASLAGCPRPPSPVPMAGPPESGRLEKSLARKWFIRGWVAERRGDLIEAENSFNWVVRVDRASPWTHGALGDFYLRHGRLNEAHASYEHAKVRGGGVDIALRHAPVLILLGEHLTAREELEQALAEEREEAYPLLIGMLIAEEPAEAAELLSRWSEKSATLENRRKRVDLALSLREWDVAAHDLAEIVRTAPVLEEARRFLDVSERACRVDLVWEWARLEGLEDRDASWHAFAVEVAEAARDARWLQTLRDDPNDAEGLSPREVVRLLSSDTRDQVRVRVAEAFLALGRPMEAQVHLGNIASPLLRARIIQALGRDVDTLRAELSHDPSRPERILALAFALSSSGQGPAATALLEGTVDWDGKEVAHWIIQGLAGDSEGARLTQEAAIDNNPCHLEALRALASSGDCGWVDRLAGAAPLEAASLRTADALPTPCDEE